MAYPKKEKKPRRLRKARRRPDTARKGIAEKTVYAVNQEQLDALADSDRTVIIAGGTQRRPLILRKQFKRRPIVADGCWLVIRPSDRNHPPDVLILGSDANVLLLGTARAEMRADSVLRAKDRSKARVYAGRLVCGGHARCSLYDKAIAIARHRAKCDVHNDARIILLEEAQAYMHHEAEAYLWAEAARAWRKSVRSTIRRMVLGSSLTDDDVPRAATNGGMA